VLCIHCISLTRHVRKYKWGTFGRGIPRAAPARRPGGSLTPPPRAPVPGLPAPRRRPSWPPEVRRPVRTATAGHFFPPRLISSVGAGRRGEAGVAPVVGDGFGTGAGGFGTPGARSAASAVDGGAPPPLSSPFFLPSRLLWW
jgi:hypothetical protein